MRNPPEYPPQVLETYHRQRQHPNLGTLFGAMYELCERIIVEFFDDTEMSMPVITMDHDGTVAGKFMEATTLGLGPVINLNPWGNKNALEMAETLAHEVMHLWEHTVGELNDNNRHNDRFHERMWALYGIRTTGTSGRHGGHDERWDEFLQMQQDLRLDWFKLPERKKTRRQYKHECPGCGASFWCRTKLNVLCDDCHRPGVYQARFIIHDDGEDEADQG